MELQLFDKYKIQNNLTIKTVKKIEYPSDVLKIDMNVFFEPKDKKEKALLFGAFSKYNHEKIRDAFIVCEKGYRQKQEEKYKSLLYLIAIIKKLK